jgi:phosphatidylserine/phosphatidylglycerophosphate/cardiolipin synthase-like enzyme
VVHPAGVPMHDKFALVETPEERLAIFGSFNWSEPSRRFNRELGVIARDAGLFGAFARRFEALREHAAAPGAGD